MPLRHRAALLLALLPAAAPAATFLVFEEGTTTLLGSFEAPAGGGALTSASLSFGGGVFDVLGTGGGAPIYDPVANDVDGAPFGVVLNSVAFATTDLFSNPLLCGAGECAFQFEAALPPVPGTYFVDSIVGGGTAIALGAYEVVPAPIPLPAGAALLGGAAALLALLGRRRAR